MGELTGELIQMNAHMVVTDGAVKLILVGATLAFVFALLGCKLFVERKLKASLILVGLAGLALMLMFVGSQIPRVKEIKSCVNGPVSLERVAAVYDIVNVDGKELTLRER